MLTRWLPTAILVAFVAGSAAGLLAGCPQERPSDYFDPPPVPRIPVIPPAAASTVEAPEPVRLRPEGPASVDTQLEPPAPKPAPIDDDARPPQRPLPTFVELFRRLSPSVVNIYTQEIVEQRLEDLLAPPSVPGVTGTSLGSGLILDAKGHILTNAHVVENAAEIRVRFDDEEELPARLVGIDPVRDLALLKVDGKTGLVPVEAGDSEDLRVGDWVLAIGNPFGLSHTLTKGIVSAVGRSEIINDRSGYIDLIQTDAAINEGNSGGPLFDLDGRVVGIATAVSAEGQGIGFAIPWEVVRRALPRLRQGGQVSRSWLGVYVRPLDGAKGVLVQGVVDDSPATRGGLLPGDKILDFDERPVSSVGQFRLAVASGATGRDVPVHVVRAGRPMALKVRLEEARDVR